MMKTIRMLISGCMCIILCHAQDKLPAFGKIERADLEMKVYDLDKDAEAVTLMDVGEVIFEENINTIYVKSEYRIRIKILKASAVDRANVKLRYRSGNRYEEITDVSGIVYDLDDAGNIVTSKLEKSQIFDKQVSKQTSEVSFALPNVKVGCVIEYKHTCYKRNGFDDIDTWYFQSDIPVRYSAYNVLAPSDLDFTYQVTRRQDVTITKPQNDREGVWYIMRDIPALKDEAYTAGLKDYVQRVDFQLAAYNPPTGRSVSFRTTWNKLTEELLEAQWFGDQLGKNISGTSDMRAAVKAMKSNTEKLRTVYRFVQRNMEWNGGEVIGTADGIKNAWDKKSGTNTEINMILISLLNDVDIKAYPCLISTRDNGKVNTTYPFLDQFNGMYVYAEVDGQAYIMNAADKYNPFDLVPYDVQMTEGFIVDKKIGGWATINGLSKRFKQNISLRMDIDEKGDVNGEAVVNSYEYARNVRSKTVKNGGLRAFLMDNEGIKVKVDSVEVNNIDNDSLPLEQKFNFTATLQNSGEYSFIPYNLFSTLGKNPFVAEKRQTDIDFNYNQYYVIMGSYNIHEDYEIEELPKNMSMIMPDTSIVLTRLMQKDDGTISFRLTIDFRRPVYAADEYPNVKEFYKKLYATLNEHIVIKKKVKPTVAK